MIKKDYARIISLLNEAKAQGMSAASISSQIIYLLNLASQEHYIPKSTGNHFAQIIGKNTSISKCIGIIDYLSIRMNSMSIQSIEHQVLQNSILGCCEID
jgi:hypothetical protein